MRVPTPIAGTDLFYGIRKRPASRIRLRQGPASNRIPGFCRSVSLRSRILSQVLIDALISKVDRAERHLSANPTYQQLQRGGLNQNMGSNDFIFQFDDAKARPNLLLLHFPSLSLTIHIPSHSEGAERASQLPLMCSVSECVTMP